MKVSKVVARFSKAPNDPTELRRVARSLGNELPRKDVDTLREFRAAIVQTPIVHDDDSAVPRPIVTGRTTVRNVDVDPASYAVGYVDSMMDVTAEYESIVSFAHDEPALSTDVVRGIQLAVQLFQQMSTSPFATDSALIDIAGSILGDQHVAAQAVEMWSRESRAAGLITEPFAPAASTARAPTNPPLATGSVPHVVADERIWADEPSFREEPVALQAVPEELIWADEPSYHENIGQMVPEELIWADESSYHE